MKLSTVREILDAEILSGGELSNILVNGACGSDLMSDILAEAKTKALLLTGLVHPQILQTASISEFAAITFVRGKEPSAELIELAKAQNFPLLRTNYTLYEACGKLFLAGLKSNDFGQKAPSTQGGSGSQTQKPLKLSYDVKGNDFGIAGRATEQAKKVLKQLGIAPAVVKRVSVAAYEAEMNIVIHAFSGKMVFNISPSKVEVVAEDIGPGIADIDTALNEGFSTAPDRVRELGFGAGMGLPNMRRFSDEFNMKSTVGEGTKVVMQIHL